VGPVGIATFPTIVYPALKQAQN